MNVKGKDWQAVFGMSPINGCKYDGEALPIQMIQWPTDTYLQRRLRELKAEQRLARAQDQNECT